MAHLNSEIFMVNRIDNVTTKTGDDGTTSLSDGKRYPKSHERIELVGALDEANSAIGMLLTLLPKKATIDRKFLTRIQSRLFDVGAVVAGGKAGNYWAAETVKVDQEINQLNQDNRFHGILVQLPLPKPWLRPWHLPCHEHGNDHREDHCHSFGHGFGHN